MLPKRPLASSIDDDIMIRATMPRSKPTLISFPKELGLGSSSKSNLKLKTLSSAGVMINLDFNGNQSKQRRSSFLPDYLREEDEKEDTRASTLSGMSRRSSAILPSNITLGTAFVMGSRPKDEQKRTMTKFCTGSKYIGEWNHLGLAGKGIYKFPHGVLYDGYFNKRGEFHGSGMLIYPNGQRIEGFWRNGKLSSSPSFVTKDNNVMCDTYCKMPDRRFQIELEKDFNGANEEYLTNALNPPRTIPTGCYDAGEGFYDPKHKEIFSYKLNTDVTTPRDITKDFDKYIDKDRLKSYHALMKEETPVAQLSKIKLKSGTYLDKRFVVNIVQEAQEKWIVENCRKAWDEVVGYVPQLYEDWTCGVKGDARIKNLSVKLADEAANKVKSTEVTDARKGSGEGESKVSALMFSFIQTHNVKYFDEDTTQVKNDDVDIGEDSEESLQALSTMFIPTMNKLSTAFAKPKIDLSTWIDIQRKTSRERRSKEKEENRKEKSRKLKFKLRKIMLKKKSIIRFDSDKIFKVGLKLKRKNASKV